MTRFEELPPELVLHVLAYLPLQSLFNLRLTSRFWHNFVEANESTIYRQAAYLHNYVTLPNETIYDAEDAFYKGCRQHSATWKAYCRRRVSTHMNWLGHGSANVRFYSGNFPDVHRIKVDETEGFVITTHYEGGVSIWDLETDALIWRLPSHRVRPYAHCEYDKGFLVFDRLGPMKEVWRLETAEPHPPSPKISLPDEEQYASAKEAKRLCQVASNFSNKGHFIPWALLCTPTFGRAYRFIYPTLAVAAAECIYLWDIPSARIVETISDIQRQVDGFALGEINYIDVNDQHVFLCGSCELRVFQRGRGALVLNVLSSLLSYGKTPLKLEVEDDIEWDASATALPMRISVPDLVQRCIVIPHEFIAVHVSPCGRHLAIFPSDNRVLLIQDFDRAVKQPKLLSDIVLEVLLRSSEHLELPSWIHEHSVYLAFAPGRVSVVSTTGIFILTLESRDYLSQGEVGGKCTAPGRIQDRPRLDPATSFPCLSASYLPFASPNLRVSLGNVSCLQMTRTKLLFTWPMNDMPLAVEEEGEPEPQLGPAVGMDLMTINDEPEIQENWNTDSVEQTSWGQESNTHNKPSREARPVLNTYDIDDDIYEDVSDEEDYEEEYYSDYGERDWDHDEGDSEAETGPIVCCVDFAAYP